LTTTRTWIASAAIVGLGLAAMGCARPDSVGATPTGATPTVVELPTLGPSPTFAGQVIDIAAKDQKFSLTEIDVAAGAAFEIRFDNRDPYQHAIYITEGPRPTHHLTEEEVANGPFPLHSEFVTGPGTFVFRVPGLSPGTYTFFCPPHLLMTGTVVVK
jgi:plastocyanin